MYGSNSPLRPRAGGLLRVGIVARISGCDNQQEQSLEDQAAHGKEFIEEGYQGPITYEVVATKGKGERLDRPELEQIEAKLVEGVLDVLIFEDLGRLVRGAEAVRLLGVAFDHGTRCLCPNDNIDTEDSTWEEDALSACSAHVGYNAQTSKRLKQKLMNRFVTFGGAPGRPIYGYVVPPGAKKYSDWLRDEFAHANIVAGFEVLRKTLNTSAVADFFNVRNVPVGPYCRRTTWSGAMVRRYFTNPLLAGRASRGRMHTAKRFSDGRRTSRKNPAGPKYWPCPHLAHLDATELESVNQQLLRKNLMYRRAESTERDRLLDVPRKRTRFPGPRATCWYCGHHYVWGGNGVTKNLMCSASREWQCWNTVGFSGELAVKKTVGAIMQALQGLERFDDLQRPGTAGIQSDSLRHHQFPLRRQQLD